MVLLRFNGPGVFQRYACASRDFGRFILERLMWDVPEIDSQNLMQLLAQPATKVLLIDVRQPQEYLMGHLPGAVLIPLSELHEDAGLGYLRALLKRHQNAGYQVELVVYCTAGVRSARAVAWLQRFGVPALSLQAGLQAWEERYIPAKRTSAKNLNLPQFQLVFQR